MRDTGEGMGVGAPGGREGGSRVEEGRQGVGGVQGNGGGRAGWVRGGTFQGTGHVVCYVAPVLAVAGSPCKGCLAALQAPPPPVWPRVCITSHKQHLVAIVHDGDVMALAHQVLGQVQANEGVASTLGNRTRGTHTWRWTIRSVGWPRWCFGRAAACS